MGYGFRKKLSIIPIIKIKILQQNYKYLKTLEVTKVKNRNKGNERKTHLY